MTLPPVIGDLPPAAVASLLSHGEDWHDRRRKGLGGSDAGKIMAGHWLSLWQDKTGRAPAQDLSSVLPAVMGTWTEPLNRYWFTQHTAMAVDLSDTGHLVHPGHDFIRANLDGRVGLGVFEAKHVKAFVKAEEVRDTYFPQCQHIMAVAQAPVCYLSVFIGTHKWEWFEIDEDPAYQADLLAREIDFWKYVEADDPPPVEVAPAIAPPPIDQMREVDMAGNNAFAAADWLGNRDAVRTFRAAEKTLKEIVDPDVKRAFGHGLEINRARNGALRIKETP